MDDTSSLASTLPFSCDDKIMFCRSISHVRYPIYISLLGSNGNIGIAKRFSPGILIRRYIGFVYTSVGMYINLRRVTDPLQDVIRDFRNNGTDVKLVH
jgi:hypothetical protein